MRLSISVAKVRLVTTGLLFAILFLAAACGSDNAPAANSKFFTVPVPAIGTPALLTPEQLIERVKDEANGVPAFSIVGEFLFYGPETEIQAATLTMEWTAPNRTRQVFVSVNGGDSQSTEIVSIGNRNYHRSSSGGWSSSEPEGIPDRDRGEPPPISTFRDFVIDGPVEVVEFNGKIAYRLTGHQARDTGDIESPDYSFEVTQTVIIDAASFRILRQESLTKSRSSYESDDLSAPEGEQRMLRVEESTGETWLEYTYLDEPLEIEPPENYVDLSQRWLQADDGPDSTPTPVTGRPSALPTPTPVMHTPTPTASPNGPAPGGPLSPATLTPGSTQPPFWTAAHVENVPAHDRLTLGDVTAIYSPCDPDSIINVPSTRIVHPESGSEASTGFGPIMFVGAEYTQDDFDPATTRLDFQGSRTRTTRHVRVRRR